MSTSQRWRLERGGHEVGTGGFAHVRIDQGPAPRRARGGGGGRRAGAAEPRRSRRLFCASFGNFPPRGAGTRPPSLPPPGTARGPGPAGPAAARGRIRPPGRKWRERGPGGRGAPGGAALTMARGPSGGGTGPERRPPPGAARARGGRSRRGERGRAGEGEPLDGGAPRPPPVRRLPAGPCASRRGFPAERAVRELFPPAL